MYSILILLSIVGSEQSRAALSQNAKSVHWRDHSEFVVTSEWERKEIEAKLRSVARIRQKGSLFDVSSNLLKLGDEKWAGNGTGRTVLTKTGSWGVPLGSTVRK